MVNAMKGESQLGDKTLAFNFGAFCELEGLTGRKTQQLLEAMAEGLSFSELRDFVWAGLQTHYPGTSTAETLAILNDCGYEAAGKAVGQAVASFFGEQKAKGKDPRKATA